jgi:hypothetical protein
MKGLFMRYLSDIAQVKVFSLRYDADADADTAVMKIALWTVVQAS